MVVDRDDLGWTRERGDPGQRVLVLLPGLEGEHVRSFLDAGGLQPGDEEDRRVVSRHDEGGEPFEGQRLVPGEVGEVGTGGGDERVDALRLELLMGPANSCAVVHQRVSSPGRSSTLAAFVVDQYSASPSAPLRCAQLISVSRSPS